MSLDDTPRDPEPRRARWLSTLRTLPAGAFGSALALLIVAVGFAVIGIGWNGAAGSGAEINGYPDIRAQLPWLLSGGFLGLALVVVGAALVVAHSQRHDRARLEAKLEELIEVTRAAAAGALAPQDLRQLVVAGPSSYHTPACRLVEGRENVTYLTPAEAVGRGLTPCRICRPDASVLQTD